MFGLAIHTASPQLGLMLEGSNAQGDPIQRHQVWELGRDVSSHLQVKMQEFMQPYPWEEVEFVAVAKGPGGFTGTRIGVVAARTLAQQLEVPLFGVSTLAAIIVDAFAKPPREHIFAVSLPAKRGAVYGAIYHPDEAVLLRETVAESVLPQADWEQKVAELKDKGSPVLQLPMEAGVGFAKTVTGVMGLARAGWRQGQRPLWSSVMPFYGQHPVDTPTGKPIHKPAAK
ncbi:MAG: tRNA (adenosine(37)-N6)-threonylcarbamoyltransferase complex dimerization subunit type 1 TsaB [Cyanobacteria bacterium J06623_5]